MPILTRMPYIRPADRPAYDPLIIQTVQMLNGRNLNAPDGDTYDVGHLNYLISGVIWTLFAQKPSYRHGSDLASTLIMAMLEFYRRQVAPYEDQKIKENGDLDIGVLLAAVAQVIPARNDVAGEGSMAEQKALESHVSQSLGDADNNPRTQHLVEEAFKTGWRQCLDGCIQEMSGQIRAAFRAPQKP